jgi:hypothetical protein
MRSRLALLGTLLFSFSAVAQFSTGTVYRPLTLTRPDGASACARTWYDPEVFLAPDGIDLTLLAQSSAPTTCSDGSIDAIQRATRDGFTGRWTTPALEGMVNGCPTIRGQYQRCGFAPGRTAGPVASPSVVRLPNPFSPTGVRYYMAFVGGNADFINGKIYWAVSNDGEKWDVYARNATEHWAPVIFAKHTRSPETPRSAPSCSQPSGIGQVQLAFEEGRFYMFFQYWHPVQPECEEGHGSARCTTSRWHTYDRALSSVLYRFDYDPAHPFGFGPAVREMYLDGAWRRHSGQLVWEYDVDDTGAQVATTEDAPLMQLYNGVQQAGFEFGAGDVKFGNGQWLRVYAFEGITRAQTATSLDPTISHWSPPQVVDTATVRERFPLADHDVSPGIWYGSLSGTSERWWMWMSLPTTETRCGRPEAPNFFAGLSLVPMMLCTPDRPC